MPNLMFEERIRNDDRTKQHGESDYEFLDRYSWDSATNIRFLICNSLKMFPNDEKDELTSRIRSRRGFASATFELLLHELLVRRGFEVDIHPMLENGSEKRPDFLVKDSDGSEFYLEAVLASEKSEVDEGVEALKERVLDRLRNSTHPDFSALIESTGDPTSAPKEGKFAKQVIGWLDSLDYEFLRDRLETSGQRSLPFKEWNLNGWLLKLSAYPLARASRGKEHGLVGTYDGGDVTWINSWIPLRNAVRTKGSRYGELDKPLIVAVNFQKGFLKQSDEIQALYGEEKILFQKAHPHRRPRVELDNNGAWRGRSGAEGKKVSGAWFFNNLTPYSAARTTQNLHVNPWSNYSVPASLLQFPCSILEDGRIQSQDGLSVCKILDLHTDWPESPRDNPDANGLHSHEADS